MRHLNQSLLPHHLATPPPLHQLVPASAWPLLQDLWEVTVTEALFNHGKGLQVLWVSIS